MRYELIRRQKYNVFMMLEVRISDEDRLLVKIELTTLGSNGTKGDWQDRCSRCHGQTEGDEEQHVETLYIHCVSCTPRGKG